MLKTKIGTKACVSYPKTTKKIKRKKIELLKRNLGETKTGGKPKGNPVLGGNPRETLLVRLLWLSRVIAQI
jgi:hypothetical protein